MAVTRDGSPSAGGADRSLVRVGGALTAAAVAGSVVTVVLLTLTPEATNYTLFGVAAGLTFPLVGFSILRSFPRHRLAWVLLVFGALTSTGAGLANAWTSYGLVGRSEPLFGAVIASWLAAWVWAPTFLPLLFFALLLFPDGHLPSPRWRWVGWLGAASTLALTVDFARMAWPLRGPALALGNDMNSTLVPFAFGAALGVLAASAASLVVRFRRADQLRRAQLKWVAYAGAISMGVVIPVTALARGGSPSLIGVFAIPLVPVAIGVAVLRYRLYEIDRLISRTVSYAIVTAVLVAVYALGVVALQALLRPFVATGSDLAVAGSTLAVAALFGPVRRRVQRFIDRRFNRAHYDGVLTVDAFGRRLRHELDLDAVAIELQRAVAGTVAPLGAGVWLRGAADRVAAPEVTPPS